MTKHQGSHASQQNPLGGEELRLIDAWWRACNYLSVGMIYLQDNPLLREPLAARARQAPPARPLGREPGAVVRVGASEPRDQARRPRRDLRRRSGPRRAGRARARLPRRHLLRDLSGQERGRGGHAEVLQAVLLPRPHRLARHAGDAGLDPRRRRARLQPVARLRRGARQPRSDRRLRGRRRRGRDRTARHRLALEQVHQPGPRRRGAADPQPQRLQDRQPDASSRASATRSWKRCSSATATSRTSSRAAIRPRCTRRWPRRSMQAIGEIRAHQQKARATRATPSARAGR